MKRHRMLCSLLVLAVISTGIFLGINLHGRSSTQATIELDKFLSDVPSRPKAFLNLDDPPHKPGIWFDRTLEKSIRLIDDGDIGVKDAIGKSEGLKIVASIQLPIEDLRRLADDGDGAAQYILSIRLRNGIKVQMNEREANRLLQLSAGNKFPLSLRAKALEYEKKPKTSNPTSKYVIETATRLYYEEAAELGDSYSMFMVGLYNYCSTTGSFNDLNKGFTWLNKALKTNDVATSINTHTFIAHFYDEIDSGYKLMHNLDLRKSYESLKFFADADIGYAQEMLGKLLWDEKFPNEITQESSRELAIKWYTKAANKGLPKSQSFLGELYASGRHVPKDSIAAAKWLTLAAEQAEYPSRTLGERFLKGDGVPQDRIKGVKWLKISGIYDNDKVSQYQLGQCYWNGHGVKKNLILAYAWLNVSNTTSEYQDSCQILGKHLSEKQILDAEELSKKIFLRIQKAASKNPI